MCRLINHVFRGSNIPEQKASDRAPSTSVIPVVFGPLTDWQYQEHECCCSEQFFSQLVISLAFEVAGSFVQPRPHTSIVVVGFGERFLNALRRYLKAALHRMTSFVYESSLVGREKRSKIPVEQFELENLEEAAIVQVVAADALVGREADVVYYCCPRGGNQTGSWSGRCLDARQQFKALTRARHRLYILVEDASGKTVFCEGHPCASEAARLGAQRCRKGNRDCRGCGQCNGLDGCMYPMRLVEFCRTQKTSEPVSIHQYADHLRRAPLWPKLFDAHGVAISAYWAARELYCQSRQDMQAGARPTREDHDVVEIAAMELDGQLDTQQFVSRYASHVDARAITSDLDDVIRPDARLDSETTWAYWRPLVIDAMNVRVYLNREIIITLPFASSMGMWIENESMEIKHGATGDVRRLQSLANVLALETLGLVRKRWHGDALALIVDAYCLEDAVGFKLQHKSAYGLESWLNISCELAPPDQHRLQSNIR